MATITIDIPDKEVNLVAGALCNKTPATLEEAKTAILEHIKYQVKAYSREQSVTLERAKLEQAEQVFKHSIEQIATATIAVKVS